MAMAVMRNVPLGQNMHLLSNNCVLVSSANNQTSMQHHLTNNINNNHNSNNNSTNHNNNHHHHQHQFGKRPIAPAIIDSQRSNNSNTSSNINNNNNNNNNNLIGNLQTENSNKINNKKKINFAHHMTPYGLSGIGNITSSGSIGMGSTIIQPASVQRRNARERNRVKQVNNGFANLRQHIPQDVITTLSNGGRGASKKLSKVDTLRLAVQYIRGLENLLGKDETDLSLTMSTGTITSPGGGSVSSSSTTSTNSSYFAASPITEQSTCSESSSSPAPSESSIGNVYVQQTIQSVQQHQQHQSTPPPPPPPASSQPQQSQPPHPHPHPHPQYKYEMYDTYNPEDEALLDCISWWQENP